MRLQQFRKIGRPTVVQPTRTKLIIQPFTLAVPTWAGSSVILAEYNVGNSDYIFSIKSPVPVFGSDFIAAVRWLIDGNTAVARFKFWDDTDGKLFYPVYNGEAIGVNAVIEIWSVNTTNAPTLSEDEILYSSVLNFPRNFGCNVCCTIPDISTLLLQTPPTTVDPNTFCNPFCLPLVIP